MKARVQAALAHTTYPYRDVIALNDADARARLNLGFLLVESGKREEGETELSRAVELDPSLASRILDGEPVEGQATGP